MTAAGLVTEFREHGGELNVEGDKVRFSCPAGFPRELLDQLRERRAEVLAQLQVEARPIHVDDRHTPLFVPGGRYVFHNLVVDRIYAAPAEFLAWASTSGYPLPAIVDVRTQRIIVADMRTISNDYFDCVGVAPLAAQNEG